MTEIGSYLPITMSGEWLRSLGEIKGEPEAGHIACEVVGNVFRCKNSAGKVVELKIV